MSADLDTPTILGTRLAGFSLIMTVATITVLLGVLLGVVFVVPFCYFTGVRSQVLIVFPFLIALWIGIRIGIRSCRY